MSAPPCSLVFLGLSLRSSWGNGHATTYRALLQALSERGHKLTFLERDKPWYADNADLSAPPFCGFHLYHDLGDLEGRHARTLRDADVIVVGSYVPEGCGVIRLALRLARGQVGFYDIDTPVTLAMLRQGTSEYISADLIPAFDFYLSFTGGPCLAQLRDVYHARFPSPFYCMVDPTRYRPVDEPKAWDLGYLGTYSADRQPALNALLIEPARRLPHLRFVVAGPQYPRTIDWPENVERIEHVPPAGHPRFYSRLRFALNLTRADMLSTGWSPSVRLFEAAACGTPILTDRWKGLDRFFAPGKEILVADRSEDVVQALTRLEPAVAARIAKRARRRILQRHTGQRRAEELERIIRIATDGASAPKAANRPAIGA